MTAAGDAGPGADIDRLRAENDALHEALLIANQAQRAAEDRATEAERAVEPMLRSFDIGDGGMSAEIAGPIVRHLAMAMAVNFRASGAANYIEMGINAVDAPFERYTVTVQRYGAKSAHMLRAEAEAERDAVRAELAAARAEVERHKADRASTIISAEWRGENRAYAQVVRSARRVYAHEGNDLSDRRAVMTFAERFLDRATLDDGDAARTRGGSDAG